MPAITAHLRGEVSAARYHALLERLSALVHALSEELAGNAEAVWYTARLLDVAGIGVALNLHAADDALPERVTAALSVVAAALADQTLIPYAPDVSRAGNELGALAQPPVDALVLTAGGRSARICPDAGHDPDEAAWLSHGLLQTVLLEADRSRLRVRDLSSGAVLTLDSSAATPDPRRWTVGQRLLVCGRIRRSPPDGRPLSVERLRYLFAPTAREPGASRRARGSLSARTPVPLRRDAATARPRSDSRVAR